MTINFRKPLYENYCRIKVSDLLECKRRKELMTVICTDKDSPYFNQKATFAPEWLLNNGEDYNQVFKYENNPMKLKGARLPFEPEKSEDEKAKEQYQFLL
jgi:hypothetical protein